MDLPQEPRLLEIVKVPMNRHLADAEAKGEFLDGGCPSLHQNIHDRLASVFRFHRIVPSGAASAAPRER
ncbi:hypothetical protein EME01_45210 [Sinorhizobium meliloti]|nr:hypothetical protein EME01_45210 [Sinorhizobium meliloti]